MANYWLFKSEPDVYGIADLRAEAKGFGRWDGIRNYQARNFLRDEVAVGDGVLVYHSQTKVPGVAGTARVVKAAYADPGQFDPESDYFDPKATRDKPRWFCVDVAFESEFESVVPLKVIKEQEPLSEMVLLKQGRLSVQPVTPNEWKYILKLGS
ncbi:EVE domain-containing protein [Marinimicrobium agarilyticum]|uniref:EVE domain-containing protein n=1 Tax=Marinimicrobium agarilyticum TaxID=306546 RepID=UPI000400C463|nr:EVE domain-containing protein [Marinimicrobium agarilyticum]